MTRKKLYERDIKKEIATYIEALKESIRKAEVRMGTFAVILKEREAMERKGTLCRNEEFTHDVIIRGLSVLEAEMKYNLPTGEGRQIIEGILRQRNPNYGYSFRYDMGAWDIRDFRLAAAFFYSKEEISEEGATPPRENEDEETPHLKGPR